MRLERKYRKFPATCPCAGNGATEQQSIRDRLTAYRCPLIYLANASWTGGLPLTAVRLSTWLTPVGQAAYRLPLSAVRLPLIYLANAG
ncbi:MAG: hypothetical protein KBF57_10600 [Saprospiraceae bacterium]|nr:hypothetical protein [Saprospiraceae bacterium]